MEKNHDLKITEVTKQQKIQIDNCEFWKWAEIYQKSDPSYTIKLSKCI